ncbi:acyl carrier protein [Streptomyces sp. NPDC020490]|uniref:acyl carrier protein n=1 Tax=Streptomyces sp. NPDC020490 TaxID=3365078 RepID=UPI0037949635
MNNPFEYEVVQDIVRTAAARVLGCPADSLSPATALVRDLGADSLDLVELRCELEDRLLVVMPNQSVLDHLVELTGTSDAVYGPDGGVTALAARVLRDSAFRYDEEQARAGTPPYEIARSTTVANWAHFVSTLFDHLPGSCPECAGTKAAVSPAQRAECADCGTALTPQAGDTVLAATVRTAAGSETAWAEATCV